MRWSIRKIYKPEAFNKFAWEKEFLQNFKKKIKMSETELEKIYAAHEKIKSLTFEKREFIEPRGRNVPDIKPVKPAEVVKLFHGIKIKKGEPMFNLVKDGKIKALDFLNDTFDNVIYRKAFVPYK